MTKEQENELASAASETINSNDIYNNLRNWGTIYRKGRFKSLRGIREEI